jgi:circadian clock protein KaiC
VQVRQKKLSSGRPSGGNGGNGFHDGDATNDNSEIGADLIPGVTTGVQKLDRILGGGYPRGSLILLAGNPGAGKTILSTQFLHKGAIEAREAGIYLSFFENKVDYFDEMMAIGMDMQNLEKAGAFSLMVASPIKDTGTETLMGLLVDEIIKTEAKRVVIDSITTITAMVGKDDARMFLQSVFSRIVKQMGVTVIMIGEVPYHERGEDSAVEFIADGVIIMKNLIDAGSEKRILQVAKMRKTRVIHSNYEYLISEKYGGVEVIVLPERFVGRAETSSKRFSTGVPQLDKMTFGGLPRGSVTLIEGPVGAGKTTMCLQLLAANARTGVSGLIISMEESVEQLRATIAAYGFNRGGSLEDKLFVEAYVPEAMTPVHYYKVIKDLILAHHPKLVVIDSLNPVKRSLSDSDYLSFTRYVQLLCKENGITGIFTYRSPADGRLHTDSDVTTIVDNMMVLSFDPHSTEEMKSQILVAKMRGSGHDKCRRYYSIDGSGMSMAAEKVGV